MVQEGEWALAGGAEESGEASIRVCVVIFIFEEILQFLAQKAATCRKIIKHSRNRAAVMI